MIDLFYLLIRILFILISYCSSLYNKLAALVEMIQIIYLIASILMQCSLISAWSHLHLLTQYDPNASPSVYIIPNEKIEPASNSSNTTYYAAIKSTDFCVKNKQLFNSSSFMANCKSELVPFITFIENSKFYTDLPIFVIFHNESKNMIKDHTGFIFQGVAGVMFRYSDSLTLRKALLQDLQTKIPVHSVDLVRIVAPELEADLNLELYHGSLFVSELERTVADEALFKRFKAFNPVAHVTHPLNIWMVYFSVWYGEEVVTELVKNLAVLCSTHPAVYQQIAPLSLIDLSVGSPETIDIQLSAEGESPQNVTLSPVQIRYFLEAALLQDSFGSLDGKHVLEIGGGYGGMAVTLQTLHHIGKYSIVDLPAGGLLQAKYVDAASKGALAVTTISSLSVEPVSSDLLISFFAISELRKDTVDRYLQQYVRHAKNGLLQLNAYEFEETIGGERTMVDGMHLYSMLDLFEAVYHVHPHAVLLPPPSFHQYHRIMWREREPFQASSPMAKTEEEMIQWCRSYYNNNAAADLVVAAATAAVTNTTVLETDGSSGVNSIGASSNSKPAVLNSSKKPAAATVTKPIEEAKKASPVSAAAGTGTGAADKGVRGAKK